MIISVYQNGFSRALRALKECGSVERSPCYNIPTMQVEGPAVLLEASASAVVPA